MPHDAKSNQTESQRTESKYGVIDVRVHDIRQLFNSLDATPFPETDLDAEAEQFILDWAMEFRSDAPILLRIHVESTTEMNEAIGPTETALRSFFAYRADVVRRRLRLLLARGRARLAIGFTCLAASIAAAELLTYFSAGTLTTILRESMLIGGWVAMWGPLEILLYDWWPVLRERRVCERLADSRIEIVPAKSEPRIATKPT